MGLSCGNVIKDSNSDSFMVLIIYCNSEKDAQEWNDFDHLTCLRHLLNSTSLIYPYGD